ncbi:MAG: flagellar motor switch protein FliM [Nitrospirae bacterium]|nr:flagellar motor switch protein FliM [Nitrospirota bacterium]
MADKMLSQDEIDSLLSGIQTGDLATALDEKKPAKAKGGGAAAPDASSYDFTHHERSVTGKYPSLERSLERFARSFRTTLSNSLRTMVDIAVNAVKAGNFGEFLSRLPLPSSIHIFKLDPLKGTALAVLETNLVFALVDIFFGGSGKPSMKIEGREFTGIESRIIQKVIHMMLEDLERALSDILRVKADYQRGEMNPQFAKIVHDNEQVFIVTFVMDLDQHSGKMYFCFPQSLFDPVRERLRVQVAEEESSDDKWKPLIRREVKSVPIEVAVELGRAHTTARELLSLKVGDIVELEQMHTDELLVRVSGVPKMKGVAGIYRGNLAVKVSALLEEEQVKNGG